MTEEKEVEIANFILNKAGILENRALIIFELEEELANIYSELDDEEISIIREKPIEYYSEVQTEFDLVSNGEIHRSLNKALTKEQKLFLKKITNSEDFYFSVQRGAGLNFSQEWCFDISFKKEDFSIDRDVQFSFTVRVGIRDLFPYEIELDYNTIEVEYDSILKHLNN